MMNKNVWLILLVVALLAAGGGASALILRQKMAPNQIAPNRQPVEQTPTTSQQLPTTQNTAVKPGALGEVMIEKSAVAISGYVLSDRFSGAMTTPEQNLLVVPTATTKLWLTVFLRQGAAEGKVSLNLTYSKDNSVLGPAYANIKTLDGKTFAVFELNSPVAGWPVGNYTGLITLPSGEDQGFDFRIQ